MKAHYEAAFAHNTKDPNAHKYSSAAKSATELVQPKSHGESDENYLHKRKKASRGGLRDMQRHEMEI